MPKEFQIVHICEDEKFINSAILQFENCFSGCNSFFIVSKNRDNSFKHVKKEDFVFKICKEDLNEVVSNITPETIVILHSLSPLFYDFVIRLPKIIKVVWFCFGFEVYNDSNYFKNYLLLDTITKAKFPDVEKSIKEKLIEKVRPYYRILKPGLPLSQRESKEKAIERIAYLGSSFKDEFEQICQLLNQKKKFFNFWYYPIEMIVDVNQPINYSKSKILIGNSGFKSNNHLDVFHKINMYSLKNLEIVVPLNYGEPKYIQEILNQGNKDFKDAFNPLLDFMPLQDYNSILESVGVAILNNKRQQAVGNTIALLWFGAKVFLSDKNPFYQYLKREGILIYCYETELNSFSCSKFLSSEEIEHNRSILFKLLNQKHLLKMLNDQISKL